MTDITDIGRIDATAVEKQSLGSLGTRSVLFSELWGAIILFKRLSLPENINELMSTRITPPPLPRNPFIKPATIPDTHNRISSVFDRNNFFETVFCISVCLSQRFVCFIISLFAKSIRVYVEKSR